MLHAHLQVFNELRARISPLRNCHYLVLPLHVSISLEGGMLMVYPFAGRNMDTVCAELRADGCKDALVKQLAQMATSVILVLQKLQSQKPKVRQSLMCCNVGCTALKLDRLQQFFL